jgi:hypothetical protein
MISIWEAVVSRRSSGGSGIKWMKQRPDISIWTKNDDKLRAIFEIKKGMEQ